MSSTAIYPPEIVLNVESEVIHAKNRKLKAVWTYEADQDLRSWHGIDAAQELTDILAEEITKEIDEEILNDLRNNARKAEDEEFRWKNRKKKILPRSITDDWEVSRFD
jgi:hypothetical protein